MNGPAVPGPPWLDDEQPHEEALSQTQIDAVLRLLDSSPRRVLDLGCGAGRLLVPLARAGHTVVGLDRGDETLARCAARLGAEAGGTRLQRGDFLEPLPFPDRSFDVALCLGNTLMTIADVDAAVSFIREVGRVLVIDGCFLVDDGPRDLWPELTEGRWQGGVSEDGRVQLVWSESDAVFALRQDEAVDETCWCIRPGERTFRLWCDGSLRLAARAAGLSAPDRRPAGHLLVMRPLAMTSGRAIPPTI